MREKNQNKIKLTGLYYYIIQIQYIYWNQGLFIFRMRKVKTPDTYESIINTIYLFQ
jgi:hypothetical protein